MFIIVKILNDNVYVSLVSLEFKCILSFQLYCTVQTEEEENNVLFCTICRDFIVLCCCMLRVDFLDMLTDIVKQHFQITYRTELLQDPKLHGPEIQAMFTRSCCPTVDSSLLSLLPSLKVVSNGGAGVDHLDVPFITGHGVKVTNTPGAVSGSAADVAMLLLLASARKIVESKGQC